MEEQQKKTANIHTNTPGTPTISNMEKAEKLAGYNVKLIRSVKDGEYIIIPGRGGAGGAEGTGNAGEDGGDTTIQFSPEGGEAAEAVLTVLGGAGGPGGRVNSNRTAPDLVPRWRFH